MGRLENECKPEDLQLKKQFRVECLILGGFRWPSEIIEAGGCSKMELLEFEWKFVQPVLSVQDRITYIGYVNLHK